MSSATRHTMKDPPQGSIKSGKGHKATLSASSATAKEVVIAEGIENIGAKERIEIADDGRTLLVSRTLSPSCYRLDGS